jgi:hypothetical protein
MSGHEDVDGAWSMAGVTTDRECPWRRRMRNAAVQAAGYFTDREIVRML